MDSDKEQHLSNRNGWIIISICLGIILIIAFLTRSCEIKEEDMEGRRIDIVSYDHKENIETFLTEEEEWQELNIEEMVIEEN